MSETVDARGLVCPQPVVLVKKALERADEVVVIVDNETAKLNVSRLAESHGFQVSIEERDEAIRLHLTKEADSVRQPMATGITGRTLLLICSSGVGRGDEVLGDVLMRSFVHTLTEAQDRPGKIIFMNSGVKLIASGSDMIDDLRTLDEQGVELLACGTCLGYYGLKDAVQVGSVSNIYDITTALLGADRVISL